jgi:hypothetical protein
MINLFKIILYIKGNIYIYICVKFEINKYVCLKYKIFSIKLQLILCVLYIKYIT